MDAFRGYGGRAGLFPSGESISFSDLPGFDSAHRHSSGKSNQVRIHSQNSHHSSFLVQPKNTWFGCACPLDVKTL